MTISRQGQHWPSQEESQSEDWPEKMSVAQARKFLGVSHAKMTSLLKSHISYELDPIDNRVKLVKRSDLEALLRQRNG